MSPPPTDPIAARWQRWREFYESPDPPRHLYLIHYEPDARPRPLLWRDKHEERVAWAVGKYERAVARAQWLADDSIPFLDAATGTEIFAEAFGCAVYRPDNDMPSARPLIHDAGQVAALRVPGLDAPALAYQFTLADELSRRAGPDALLRLPDIQSPMDIAALIWDKNDFYPAMLESPQAVRELAAKVAALLTAFLDEWFRRYGPRYMAHYPDYPMFGGLTLSEDEVGAVSAEVFEQFFLPELATLSQRYGHLGMHCCANSRHQWPGFRKVPNLRLLNLVHGPALLTEAYRYFADHVPQMHNWCGDGPAWERPARLPAGSRVVLDLSAATREEALELADKMPSACARR